MVLEVLPGRDHQTLEQVKDKAMRAGREGIQGFP